MGWGQRPCKRKIATHDEAGIAASVDGTLMLEDFLEPKAPGPKRRQLATPAHFVLRSGVRRLAPALSAADSRAAKSVEPPFRAALAYAATSRSRALKSVEPPFRAEPAALGNRDWKDGDFEVKGPG
jgi:hypothetical protein